MNEHDGWRRRADSALIAGEAMLVQHPSGTIARIAVVIDQLDDEGFRTPLLEDVLTAFPQSEVHVASDRRCARGAPVAGSVPALHDAARPRRGLFGRRPPPSPLGDTAEEVDVVLRVGDRRTRAFSAPPATLDLAYILAMGDDGSDPERAGRLGPSLEERSMLQSSDAVWCASHGLTATLRQRCKVDAALLCPPVELPAPARTSEVAPTRVVAVHSPAPAWTAHLATLARFRKDLEIVVHGAGARGGRGRAGATAASSAPFAALLGDALAVLMPPSAAFDPRAIWAQAAGVPVIAPMRSAAAETVEGLERRAPTGLLLETLHDDALLDAVDFVERHRALFDGRNLRRQAARWSRARFRQTLKSLVFEAWCAHLAALAPPAAEPEAARALAAATH